MLQSERDEALIQVESAERAKRQAESEAHEIREQVEIG